MYITVVFTSECPSDSWTVLIIISIPEQVGGEAVPELMTTHRLGDPRRPHRLLELLLHAVGGGVVAAHHVRARHSRLKVTWLR